jgi:hypothetical protein
MKDREPTVSIGKYSVNSSGELEVKDNHHVAGKDMCVGFLCIGVWGERKSRHIESDHGDAVIC